HQPEEVPGSPETPTGKKDAPHSVRSTLRVERLPSEGSNGPEPEPEPGRSSTSTSTSARKGAAESLQEGLGNGDDPEPMLKLVVTVGPEKRVLPLGEAPLTVGRDPENAITIE